jgi:hypothetical protein
MSTALPPGMLQQLGGQAGLKRLMQEMPGALGGGGGGGKGK